MEKFKVHFCQDDNVLRSYTVTITNNSVKDSSCYSTLITGKGIHIMQKLFRDYLYNTFELYQPYPDWNSVSVHLASNIKDFSNNKVNEMRFFKVDNKEFLYGFKVSVSNDSVTLYVLAI